MAGRAESLMFKGFERTMKSPAALQGRSEGWQAGAEAACEGRLHRGAPGPRGLDGLARACRRSQRNHSASCGRRASSVADRTEFLESIRHRTRRGRYKPTKSPDSLGRRDRPSANERRSKTPKPGLSRSWRRWAGTANGSRTWKRRASTSGSGAGAGSGATRSVGRRGARRARRRRASGRCRRRGRLWHDAPDLREIAGRADIGLSTATWAIAETGSLVLEHGPGRGRSVTLLPPTYVAILPADRVLQTVPEAIRSMLAALCQPTSVSTPGRAVRETSRCHS